MVRRILPFLIASMLLLPAAAGAQDRVSREEFRHPDISRYGLDSWWHWQNGNISRDGIRKDLESMHANGIKRATILNVQGTGRYVPKVAFASGEWFGMFRYALDVADSLGMRIGVHNCDGWSTSGGPWVTPELSMKTYTWSSVRVKGGRTVDMVLPEPVSEQGFYRDWAVVAFPGKAETPAYLKARPTVTVNGVAVGNILCDGNPRSYVTLHEGDVIRIRLRRPLEVSSVAVLSFDPKNNHGTVALRYGGEDLVFSGSNKMVEKEAGPLRSSVHEFVCLDKEIRLSELELLEDAGTPSYSPSFSNFLHVTSSVRPTGIRDMDPVFTKGVAPVMGSAVLDLTDMVGPDGRLEWKAPAGDWTIVRFGYTSTGATNSPATPEGTGLECDKMDPDAVEYHFNHFPSDLVRAAGQHTGRTFEFLLIDSWECGYTNWTRRFPEEFEALNGYSLKPWIPALCGSIVDGEEETAAFLHDYQKTIAALINRNYYQKFADLCHAAGLQMHAEPIYGNSMEYPAADALEANAIPDLPMTEFWAYAGPDGQPYFDRREFLFDEFAIDASLIHDKQVIGAEAYTCYSNFSDTPQLLKSFGDAAYCAGINQFILHTSVHQPLDIRPVLTLMDTFGGNFNRNNPWWTMARPWGEYHARMQYVLQHGRPVVDALYYLGDQYTENFPLQLTHNDVPFGYRANACDYNFLDRMQEAGFRRLIIPEGVMLEERTKAGIAALEASGVEIYHAVSGETIPFETEPDFSVKEAEGKFRFIHKRLESQDAYLVFNQSGECVHTDFFFRTGGRIPELWDPETGDVNAPEEWTDLGDGRTRVRIAFKPGQSLFVVFAESSCAPPVPVVEAVVPVSDLSVDITLRSMLPAPEKTLHCDALTPLTRMQDDSIRRFGGYVDYRIVFDAPPGLDRSGKMAIDIGPLSAVARVSLNGKELGTVWHDDTDLPVDCLLEKGNELMVTLATTLHNSMTAGDGLFPSGLTGPVTIKVYR